MKQMFVPGPGIPHVYKGLLYLVLLVVLLASCRKEESLFVFKEKERQPPATGKDTAIAVTALLNGDSFLALGRAAAPDDSIKMSFYNVASGSFLDIRLLADTPGTYTLGRAVSAYTAVYYLSAKDKSEQKGYTSRATEDAGGTIKVAVIDTQNHKIKGSFELMLRSRTDTTQYTFSQGNFDILYNHAVMDIDGRTVNAIPNISGLETGTPTAPIPRAIMNIGDSLNLSVMFDTYKGPGNYGAGDNLKILLRNQKNGKEYHAEQASAVITRFNYREFLQVSFEGTLKAGDGSTLKISRGSFVMGN
ncbi:DUF6252 family protein [Taibaiella chishuiensis]|uniref:Uncharacterized protein n=1 Tax=Taibaiella chishuiensis TaxID=1434707 RepID=A0A2P8D0N5_9BACT|nr:DUF6252 family protein [Taibaiella chishuiensis]PSK90726.1 hypothetical protein B0I18_107136 [Taibaiella chishuiensis]